MKKITINKNGLTTHQVEMEDAAANSWLAYHIELGTFGMAAYTYEQEVEPAVLDEDGNVISPAVNETMTVDANYQVVIEDITNQVEQALVNKNAQDFLNSTDWKVLRHSDQLALGIAMSLTDEEYLELLQQRQTARASIIR